MDERERYGKGLAPPARRAWCAALDRPRPTGFAVACLPGGTA